MKKLIALVAIVALFAPAVAVCAGAEPSATRPDCCPIEEMTAGMGTATTSMADACCAMSDEAGQRVPAPTQTLVTSAPTAAPAPAWCHLVSGHTPALHVHTAPVSVDHVPRHLLLSVLIV